jgi:hypothetical protein
MPFQFHIFVIEPVANFLSFSHPGCLCFPGNHGIFAFSISREKWPGIPGNQSWFFTPKKIIQFLVPVVLGIPGENTPISPFREM